MVRMANKGRRGLASLVEIMADSIELRGFAE